jgi:HemY protein
MIRVLIYLVIVALLAFGAVWLAERPGDVVITWQGERVETSVMVLMAAAAAVAVAAVMLWSIARAIVRSPDAVSRFLRNRRGVRAYQAVSHGLIAVGSGDARAAKRFTAEARRIAPSEPLTLLLSAQAAQLPAIATRPRSNLQLAGRDDAVLGHQPVRRGAARGRRPALLLCRGGRQTGRGPPWPGRRCWNSAALPATRTHRRKQHEERADRQDRHRRQRAVLLPPRRSRPTTALLRRHRANPMPVANARRRWRSRR